MSLDLISQIVSGNPIRAIGVHGELTTGEDFAAEMDQFKTRRPDRL